MISMRTFGTAFVVLFSVLLSGCDDDLFQQRWTSNPQDGVIYALARPELNLPSAYSLYESRAYRVEAAGSSGRWDFAFDIVGGQPVLLPPGALGVASEARILARPGETFESIQRAPDDLEEYSLIEPVPVQVGQLYIVRTGQQIGAFGTRCVYYAKMRVEGVDLERSLISFRYDLNTICNSRRLQPDR